MPSAGEQFGLSFQRPSDPALMRGSGRKSADRAGNEVAVHSRIQPGNHVAGDGDRITAFAVGALRAAGPSGAITCRDMPKLAAGRAPDGPICSTCSTLPTATCSICSEGKPCGMLAEIGDDRTRFADRRGLKAFAGSRPDHPQRQENRCAAAAYQEPAPGRRRPDLGSGIAARLAGRAPPLRRPPRRRRLEPPSPTTPVQQIPRPTSPLPTNRPALRRTPGVSTSSPTCGLTFNFVRCLSSTELSTGDQRVVPSLPRWRGDGEDPIQPLWDRGAVATRGRNRPPGSPIRSSRNNSRFPFSPRSPPLLRLRAPAPASANKRAPCLFCCPRCQSSMG